MMPWRDSFLTVFHLFYILQKDVHVKYQGNCSISKDCRTGDALNITIHLSERFNDGLMLADHMINDKADSGAMDVRYDNLFNFRALTGYPEMLAQRYVGDDSTSYMSKIPSCELFTSSAVSSMHSSTVASGSTK